MNTYKEKLFLIQQDLALVEERLVSVIQSPVKLVSDIGTHLLKAGGKRLRPALYLLCAYDGVKLLPDRQRVLPIAVSLELIHMATLVHDDIIDNSITRRGKPTTNALWGNQAAVLTGDFLFAKAISSVASCIKPQELEILSNILSIMCEGEITQHSNFFNTEQTEEDYLERIFQKTANFIASSCQLGAIAGGFSDTQITTLRQYGYCLGMAFQITDDILDITASPQEMGKPTGHDLLQGVINLPVIRALETSEQRLELKKLIERQDISNMEIEQALDIVRATDAVEYSYTKVRNYLREAREAIPAFLSEEVKDILLDVVNFVEMRRF